MISADVNSDVCKTTRNKENGRLAVYILCSSIKKYLEIQRTKRHVFFI